MEKTLVSRIAASLLLGSLAFAPAIAHADAKTERTWKSKCASCHGSEGKGDTEQGKKQGVEDMSSAAWQSKMTDAKITEAIESGVKREKDGHKQNMQAYKGKLTPDEIKALVAQIRSFKK